MKIPNLSKVKTQEDIIQLVAGLIRDGYFPNVETPGDDDNDERMRETKEEVSAYMMLEFMMNEQSEDYTNREIIAYLAGVYSLTSMDPEDE